MKQLFLISIGWALVGLACCNTIAAQEPTQQPTPMTAADCMAYAVSHNRDVRKAALTLDSYQANRLGAIGDFLPAVSASGSAQYNFGRGIDPETNTYTNVTTFSNGFGISASLPVFDGLARLHALRMARADVLMGKSALQRQQADVALQTLQAFIDAQYYQGTVAMAEEKEAESLLLLRQARLLEEVGRKSPADVAQMEAQQAEASVEVIRQRNLLQQAMLNLKHIMNWQEDPSQDPSRPPREGEEKTSPSMGRAGKAPFLTDGRGRGLYRKIAAAFAGAILMAGLLFAAVRPFFNISNEEDPTASVTTPFPPREGQGEGLLQEGPVVFQDAPLDSILTVVAQHYGKVVLFRNEEVRTMRLIMTWQPTDSLSSLIGRLNLFEGLQLTLQADTLIVEIEKKEGE